jgi:hypothetical protein
MIDKMVEVFGADAGRYRNVWPPAIETLIKQIQERVRPFERTKTRADRGDAWSSAARFDYAWPEMARADPEPQAAVLSALEL